MEIDIEAFYKKFGPMVYRRCRYLLGNEDAAVDAMQDTFVRIMRGKDRLDSRAPSSLLYTTATNLCLNIIRDRKRRGEQPWEDWFDRDPAGEDWEKRVMNDHFLDRLFGEMEESTRDMAFLHYVDGFTLEETAEQTGLSVSGVRKRLRRLREKGLALKEA